jgi:hypothetical protein
MISKTTLELFTKPENFITHYNDLKPGFLYLLNDKFTSHIMIITDLHNGKIQGDLVETMHDKIEKNKYPGFFDMYPISISTLPETHKSFKTFCFALYEMGPKENYPEYFL